MKYSVTIALFLGHVSATATTWEDLANGSCSIDTVSIDQTEDTLTTCSSLEECAADADCADSDEKCGYFAWTSDGSTTVEDGKCVYKYSCNDVGLRGAGQTWQLLCYDDTEPDTLPDTSVIFANVEDIVNEAETKDWTTGDIANMKIPSRDNFQTGRWIKDSETTLWSETDKPKNNLCTANSDCGTGECCANWPDSNNLRCVSSDLAGVEQEIPPFLAFTPACAVDANQAPTSAKDDLASEAAAKAAEELATFDEDVLQESKTAAGYDDMTAAEEEQFDEDWAEVVLEEEARDAAWREDGGYADMDDAQKAVFDADLLAWKEKTWAKCKPGSDSASDIECLKADEIFNEEQVKRAKDGYYTEMDAEEREEYDEDFEEAQEKIAGEIAAAYLEANPILIGPGVSCDAEKKCADSTHCCGTSTRGDMEGAEPTFYDSSPETRENTCAQGGGDLRWFDQAGTQYTHICGASKLLAAASAIFAAASLM